MFSQESMISSRLDGCAIPELHPVDVLQSIVDPSCDACVRRTEVIVQPLDHDVVVLIELVNSDAPARRCVKDERVSG
jgi:hypothetical protein